MQRIWMNVDEESRLLVWYRERATTSSGYNDTR